MDIKTYSDQVNDLVEHLAKDESGNGHNYQVDLSDMERVCNCGAVYGKGQWWALQCDPSHKTYPGTTAGNAPRD